MATAKVYAVKAHKGRTRAGTASRKLSYVTDPAKTGGGELVSGVNCEPAHAAERFEALAVLHGALRGEPDPARERACYHAVQSFAPGEADPETAHAIGRKLAEEFAGEGFPCVVATHTDKGHVHNHIVVGAYSLDGSGKFRDRHRSGARVLRGISDRLCREAGLSVPAVSDGRARQRHGRLLAGRALAAKTALAAAAERCLAKNPATLEALCALLAAEGYPAKLRGKGLLVSRPPEKKGTMLSSARGLSPAVDGLLARLSAASGLGRLRPEMRLGGCAFAAAAPERPAGARASAASGLERAAARCLADAGEGAGAGALLAGLEEQGFRVRIRGGRAVVQEPPALAGARLGALGKRRPAAARLAAKLEAAARDARQQGGYARRLVSAAGSGAAGLSRKPGGERPVFRGTAPRHLARLAAEIGECLARGPESPARFAALMEARGCPVRARGKAVYVGAPFLKKPVPVSALCGISPKMGRLSARLGEAAERGELPAAKLRGLGMGGAAPGNPSGSGFGAAERIEGLARECLSGRRPGSLEGLARLMEERGCAARSTGSGIEASLPGQGAAVRLSGAELRRLAREAAKESAPVPAPVAPVERKEPAAALPAPPAARTGAAGRLAAEKPQPAAEAAAVNPAPPVSGKWRRAVL